VASDLTVIVSDAVHVTASFGRVIAVVWRGPMTPAAVRAMLAPVKIAAERAPGEVVYVNVVEPTAPVPGDGVRAAYAEQLRANYPLRCSVIVAEGAGFRGSLVRSVVTSLVLLARPDTPMTVSSTVAEAAKWASTQGTKRGGSELEREVIRVVEATRAQIGIAAPAPAPAPAPPAKPSR
jgi:hypothetical protein